MALVLLTNVTQYAGPGALDGLLSEGHNVACHDASFTDAGHRADFDAG
jgi:3-oxoacyl-[acyl-carrier protein] reductase